MPTNNMNNMNNTNNTNNTTQSKIKLGVELSREDWRPGHWVTKHKLFVTRKDGTSARFALGGWNKDGEGRLVQDGPMVKGPVAYAYGLCTVMAADPEQGSGAEHRRGVEEKTEHEVDEGSVIELDGVAYTVRLTKRGHDIWVALKAV